MKKKSKLSWFPVETPKFCLNQQGPVDSKPNEIEASMCISAKVPRLLVHWLYNWPKQTHSSPKSMDVSESSHRIVFELTLNHQPCQWAIQSTFVHSCSPMVKHWSWEKLASSLSEPRGIWCRWECPKERAMPNVHAIWGGRKMIALTLTLPEKDKTLTIQKY